MRKINKISLFLCIVSLTLASCTKTKFPTSTDFEIAFNDTLSYDTLTDIDGNIYHTIKIGTQTWMASNLKVTKFQNGDLIGTTSKNINSKDEPNYQWTYKGDEKNAKKFGRLYTWYAVNDKRNLAPEGWHIATESDWNNLEEYVLINPGVSLNFIKSITSATDWNIDLTDGAIGNDLLINNSTGLTILPGGRRYADGTYNGINQFCYFWTNLASDSNNAYYRILGYCNSTIYKSTVSKKYGFSVRCVKDN